MTDKYDRYLTEEDDDFDRGAGWYFWDEVWAYRTGPFKTRDICIEVLEDYILHLGLEPIKDE